MNSFISLFRVSHKPLPASSLTPSSHALPPLCSMQCAADVKVQAAASLTMWRLAVFAVMRRKLAGLGAFHTVTKLGSIHMNEPHVRWLLLRYEHHVHWLILCEYHVHLPRCGNVYFL